MSRAGVDTHGVRSFRAPAVRAWLLRVLLGGAAVGLVIAATASARDLDASAPGLLPPGTTGVAVVDLSVSVVDEDYRTVEKAFRRLIAESASIGLVVFSDVPYELLPPGTPASELRPMLRLLVPPRRGPTVNPWVETFRAGTRVSAALQLALQMLERHDLDSGSILLISDLETAPDDIPVLARTVAKIRRSSIELRVVGIAPSREARLIFAGMIQKGAFDTSPNGVEAAARETGGSARLPVRLLVLAALSLLALALHERFAGVVAITRGARGLRAGT